MQVRHILRVAIFCGALGALGGQSVHAQPVNQIAFVRTLLLQESRQIFTDNVAISRQNHGIRLLNLLSTITPTTSKQAHQLLSDVRSIQRSVVQLQVRINNTTNFLLSLESQLSAALVGFPTPNPYSEQAAHNAAIINALATRGPFGVPPASISQ